jgi:2-polyprenyl-3-methyl-5-hydroxy-6-metoxy-1,4-benzoquinol methylase
MRNDRCPICGSESAEVLHLHFNTKMSLPTEISIRHCASDNFLFMANGDQECYDAYYKSLANDSYHAELAGCDLHSPIAKLQRDQLALLLDGFFCQPKNVLDFGCGEGWLLLELASEFPSSIFRGFDPSPGAAIGSLRAQKLGLKKLTISDQKPSDASYDLIIASHVVEHLLNFELLHTWNSLLSKNGLLYIEVPNSLQYASQERGEFLYYFDRIHVNHFTPQALVRLLAAYGFGYVGRCEYNFPYRDGGEYPALGMLFRKGQEAVEISSQSIREKAMRYISQEQGRAKALSEQLKTFEGVLVWGAGDNFYRSSENGGPLSDLPTIIVLDKRPQVITIGGRTWTTQIPAEGIRRSGWPVIITVSEGRQAISQQVKEIDPSRQVFFL